MDPESLALLDAAFGALAARRGIAAPPRPLGSTGPLPVPPPVHEIEDLGHLYESLLAPTARQHAGAHYTPRALAEEVVAGALAPLTGDVLDLRVVDIAAGTGAFLLASARFLAGRLCEAGGCTETEALRRVVTTCLYGADLDPVAARLCRLSLWLLAADPQLPLTAFDHRILYGDALLDSPPVGVERPTIDWAARLPEIHARGGFDVVLGNPPFLGVKRIREAVGPVVRDAYARTLLDGESGRSDLVVFFLARAAQLSRGAIAYVLPDAVTDGDTARFGIDRLRGQGFVVQRMEKSRPWPGQAGVRICLVWLGRADELDPRRPELAHRVRPTWMPHGFQASIVLGKCLLLTSDEAAAMVAEDARASAWIREYLSGDDLVSSPGPSSSRYVLDLGAADLATLEAVPPIARRLIAVRAEREAQFAKYPQLVPRWWGFLNRVDRLYDEIGEQEEVIAFAKHAKYLWPVLVRTGPVFSNGAIVYPSSDRAVYGFLASTPHRIWAIEEGGSRLNESNRYNPSRLLRTYPFPESLDGVEAPGAALAEAVRDACDQFGSGITDLLNRVHGGDDASVVRRVRTAMTEVDLAVLAAHGITETDPVAIKRALDQQARDRQAS